MTPSTDDTSMDDRFVLFWSEYLVWSLILCCYCANIYLFSVIRDVVVTYAGTLYALELVVGVYTFFGLKVSEALFRKVYRPRFFLKSEVSQAETLPEDAIMLTKREYEYRKLGEIKIGNSVMFVLFNFMIALCMGKLLNASNMENLMIGAVAGLVSFVFTLFGIACMVGEGPSGKRSLIAQALGFFFLLPPAFFILHSLSKIGEI